MHLKKTGLFTSVIITGSALLTLSAWLSGCEFGNRSKTELTGYDTISGYYASLPQTLVFRANVGINPTRVQNGTVNQIPVFLRTVMANPTMLYFDDPIGGAGSLRAHSDTGLGIPTKIKPGPGTFGVSGAAYADVAGCRFQQEITNAGSFSQSATTSVVSGLSVRGKITLDYAITYSMIGEDADCDGMRAAFKSCYVDDVGCSADPQSILYRGFVQQVFEPFVNAGVITDTEIAAVRSVSYRATYQ